MISLARANLIHDWRRHVTAIIVLVLAGLLMTIQIGFVLGYVNSFGELERQLSADVVIKAKQLGGYRRSIDSRHEGAIWMHPNVELVQAWTGGSSSQWQVTDKGRPHRVLLSVIDTHANSLTYPSKFPEDLRAILATPGVVVLPRASAKALNAKLGDRQYLGSVEVTVGGIVNGLGSLSIPRIFLSQQTQRLTGGTSSNRVTSFLLKLKDNSKKQQTIAELNVMLAPIKLIASTPSKVARNTGLEELFQGPGMVLLGSAVFALLVGCGIASQTLRAAFLAQTKEFGSLRALGVRRRSLAGVAMEQAFWTGLVSIPIAAVLAHILRIIAAFFDVIISLPLEMMLASSGLLMLVALFAGLVSLTAVMKAEPAELLR